MTTAICVVFACVAVVPNDHSAAWWTCWAIALVAALFAPYIVPLIWLLGSCSDVYGVDDAANDLVATADDGIEDDVDDAANDLVATADDGNEDDGNKDDGNKDDDNDDDGNKDDGNKDDGNKDDGNKDDDDKDDDDNDDDGNKDDDDDDDDGNKDDDNDDDGNKDDDDDDDNDDDGNKDDDDDFNHDDNRDGTAAAETRCAVQYTQPGGVVTMYTVCFRQPFSQPLPFGKPAICVRQLQEKLTLATGLMPEEQYIAFCGAPLYSDDPLPRTDGGAAYIALFKKPGLPFKPGHVRYRIRTCTGKTLCVALPRDARVEQLKSVIFADEGIEPARQRLEHAGRQLLDGERLYRGVDSVAPSAAGAAAASGASGAGSTPAGSGDAVVDIVLSYLSPHRSEDIRADRRPADLCAEFAAHRLAEQESSAHRLAEQESSAHRLAEQESIAHRLAEQESRAHRLAEQESTTHRHADQESRGRGSIGFSTSSSSSGRRRKRKPSTDDVYTRRHKKPRTGARRIVSGK